jgi:hypothetical protein
MPLILGIIFAIGAVLLLIVISIFFESCCSCCGEKDKEDLSHEDSYVIDTEAGEHVN